MTACRIAGASRARGVTSFVETCTAAMRHPPREHLAGDVRRERWRDRDGAAGVKPRCPGESMVPRRSRRLQGLPALERELPSRSAAKHASPLSKRWRAGLLKDLSPVTDSQRLAIPPEMELHVFTMPVVVELKVLVNQQGMPIQVESQVHF